VNKDTNVEELVKKHTSSSGWDDVKRKKVKSVIDAVKNTQGWAIIGGEGQSVRALLELKEGTFIGFYPTAITALPPPHVNYVHNIAPKHATQLRAGAKKKFKNGLLTNFTSTKTQLLRFLITENNSYVPRPEL